MKFRYIFILMFITVFGFQAARDLNLGKLFPAEQKMNYSMNEGMDGDLNIKFSTKYLILTGSENSAEIENNLIEAFKFAKTKYDVKKINETGKIDFSPYTGIVITAEDYTGINGENFENIKKFISDGHFLFIAQRALNSPFNSLLGIENIKGFKTLYGLQINKEIYPGLSPDIKLGENYIDHNSLDIEIPKDSEILVMSKENIPLIWEKEYGKGRIIYSNSDFFSNKVARGLLKQLIAYESKIDFSVILNAKIFHIDDFPAPVPKLENALIEKEYGIRSDDFYSKIWLKDMYALSKRNKMVYTGFLIGEYNNKTDKEGLEPISKETYKELARNGEYNFKNNGEIGLHGYNHNPLVLKGELDSNEFKELGYVPWKDLDSMKESLLRIKNLYKDMYGDKVEIYSYVAPSNYIGKTGKEAVIETFPSINNFAGVFFENPESSLLSQEVGRDKDYKEIYSLPRFTAGYNVGDEEKWQTYSALALYGYFSHFIHPDDVFDPVRGFGKNWEKLRENFEDYVKEIDSNFPYLDAKKQMELVQSYKNIENLEVDTELSDKTIFINIKKYSSPFYATLRVRNEKMEDKNSYKKLKIENISGATYKYMVETEEFTLYLIKVESPKIEIKLGE